MDVPPVVVAVETGAVSAKADKTIFALTIGPSVDAFPDPKGGFHVGGGLGYGTMNAVNYTSTGYELHVFTGYDFWIGNNWSIGPMLRFMASKTSKDVGAGSIKDTTTSIALMVTVLDH